MEESHFVHEEVASTAALREAVAEKDYLTSELASDKLKVASLGMIS